MRTIMCFSLSLVLYFGLVYATTPLTSCNLNLNKNGETYVLQNDVQAKRSCFALRGSDITLDLNGFEVRYDTIGAQPQNGNFEAGSGTWSGIDGTCAKLISGGSFANPAQVMSGSKSLGFSPSQCGTKKVVTSSTKVSLEQGQYYQITFNPNLKNEEGGHAMSFDGKVRLTVNVKDGSTILSTHSETKASWRSMEMRRGKAFKADRTKDVTLEIVFEVLSSVSVSGRVYIDDVYLSAAGSSGVILGSVDWLRSRDWQTEGYLADVTSTGSCTRCTLKNGKVTQVGKSSSVRSIMVGDDRGMVTVDNVQVYVQGDNGNAFWSNSGGIRGLRIKGCTFTSDVVGLYMREYFDGSVLKIGNVDDTHVFNNRIIGGPQSGIVIACRSLGGCIISQNQISLRTWASNGFGVVMWQDGGSQIVGNTIDCTSDPSFACRGVGTGADTGGAGHGGTYIARNNISVRARPTSKEYGGCYLGGAYAIAVEPTNNVTVTKNNIRAVSDGNNCESAGLRWWLDGQSSQIRWTDNTVAAITTTTRNGHHAKCILTGAQYPVTFEDNTCETNDLIMETESSSVSTFKVRGMTIKIPSGTSISSLPSRPIVGSTSKGGIWTNTKFASSVLQAHYYSLTRAELMFTVEVRVQVVSAGRPVSGASVAWKDKDGTIRGGSATTRADGWTQWTELPVQRTGSSSFTRYPYGLSVQGKTVSSGMTLSDGPLSFCIRDGTLVSCSGASASPTPNPGSPSSSPTRRPRSPSSSPTRRPRSPSSSPTRRPRSPSSAPTRRPRSPSSAPTRRPGSPSSAPTRRPGSSSPMPSNRPGSPSPAVSIELRILIVLRRSPDEIFPTTQDFQNWTKRFAQYLGITLQQIQMINLRLDLSGRWSGRAVIELELSSKSGIDPVAILRKLTGGLAAQDAQVQALEIEHVEEDVPPGTVTEDESDGPLVSSTVLVAGGAGVGLLVIAGVVVVAVKRNKKHTPQTYADVSQGDGFRASPFSSPPSSPHLARSNANTPMIPLYGRQEV